jgi:TolB protein
LVILAVAGISWAAVNYEGFETTTEVIAQRPVDVLAATLTETQEPTASPTLTSTIEVQAPTPTNGPMREAPMGSIIFANGTNGHSQLFSYLPGELAPLQLTYGAWDSRDPAVSPDEAFIAFASNMDGNWDIYVLEFETREIRRLTATIGYEGRPSWSPDGQWITYETYYEGNFDVWLLPIQAEGQPIRLTSLPSIDYSPVWSPDGRKIIFVSNRDGEFDLYMADLDASGDRFINLTNTAEAAEMDPSLSPDENRIAYVSMLDGIPRVVIADFDKGLSNSRILGQGVRPAWSPDGSAIIAAHPQPYESFLVAYTPNSSPLPSLGITLSGKVEGLDWMSSENGLHQYALGGVNEEEPLFEAIISNPQPETGRHVVVDLAGVSAPLPMLSDAVDEAYLALQQRIAKEVGWDFLGNLEYAFVGLNDPMPPGFAYNDWLFTGRAFCISEAIVRSGWVEVAREGINGETYWRIFVRARYQDGSLGEPLRDRTWDFSIRSEGDPAAYDRGGAFRDSVPTGYYIDFTNLAQAYGFLRQPALPNWRTYYAGTRYGEFALMEGLTWEEAMYEIYPPSAVRTPTPFHTPTMTPTRTPRPTATPWWLRWQTPTPTNTAIVDVTSTPMP